MPTWCTQPVLTVSSCHLVSELMTQFHKRIYWNAVVSTTVNVFLHVTVEHASSKKKKNRNCCLMPELSWIPWFLLREDWHSLSLCIHKILFLELLFLILIMYSCAADSSYSFVKLRGALSIHWKDTSYISNERINWDLSSEICKEWVRVR